MATPTLRFDRGTILIEGLAPQIAAALPETLYDPRVERYRAPALRLGAVRAELARRGVAFVDATEAARVATGDAWQPISLRPYQSDALLAWELGDRRGIVVLPTGAGKTRLALAAIARVGGRALCLVPTRVLLEQWQAEIARFYRGRVGCYGDGTRRLEAVTVSTFESAWRHMARIGDRFETLVVDEAHHFGGGARDEALEMAVAARRLGLTATPPRPGASAERLVDLLGPVVYERRVSDLAGRYLADFEVVVLEVELTAAERRFYDEEYATFRRARDRFASLAPGGSWADFARAAARSPDGRRAMLAWRRVNRLLRFPERKREAVARLLGRHRSARVLVFTADNETAYDVARRHLVMPFTCDIGRAERTATLERFRTGEIRALVSARVLNEGIDVPDADVAIVVGGAMGEREHVQRVGRLLRPAEGKRAVVYELIARGTLEARQGRRRRRGLVA